MSANHYRVRVRGDHPERGAMYGTATLYGISLDNTPVYRVVFEDGVVDWFVYGDLAFFGVARVS
jgi:hypothetical protein